MEQFNHKIIKLKKDIVDITENLNKFKIKNHNNITRILDNLSTIPKSPDIQSIDTNNNKDLRIIKDNISNNSKKNNHHIKQSVSLEKNNQCPFIISNKNSEKISFSPNNLNYNTYKKKRHFSSYLIINNNNDVEGDYKNKNIFIKNEKEFYDENIDNKYLYEKIDKINNNKDCSTLKIMKNDSNSLFKDINKKITKSNKYKTIDDKYSVDKENQNFNSNLYELKYNKDMNIYSFNPHFINNKNKCNDNNTFLYNETLSRNNNNKDIYLNQNNNNSNMNINHKISDKKNLGKKVEIIDLNTISYNFISNENNNNIINENSKTNINNILQGVNIDNLYKNSEIIDSNINNNIYNNKKNNLFRDKSLSYKNKNNINENNYKKNENKNIEKLFKNLDVNNIEEAKIKIINLMKYQKYYSELENIYCKYNSENKNYNSNNILLWIYEICNYFNEINYKSYFDDIMKKHKLKNFEQLKLILNNYISKN